MAKSIPLTPDLENKILASIRAGGFAPVAAQAWGVPPALLERWLARGRRKNAREPYRSFRLKVEQAQAQSRLKAEMEAFANDPKCWLQHGPGKELPGKPGWSALAKPAAGTTPDAGALFANAELLRLLAALRTLVAPYPDLVAQLEEIVTGAEVRRETQSGPNAARSQKKENEE